MLLLQALGSNGSGQLGLGHKEDVSSPEPVLLPASLTTSNLQPKLHRIAAGGNHTLLLFTSGDLLWSGVHTTGACGRITPEEQHHDNDNNPDLTPQFRPVDLQTLPAVEKVKHIAATWTASILVTTTSTSPSPSTIASPSLSDNKTPQPQHQPQNKIYTLGIGPKGELGLGQTTLSTHAPTQIPDFPPLGTHITDLAACMSHAVAVLSNGEAWGWGNGRKGQLGEPATATVPSPRRIDGAGFPVVKAVCGREFTCLFGPPETGEIAVLGSDKWGVRSQCPDTESIREWKEVGAGWGSLFVLREDGRLLSWGRDDHGQLARGNEIGRVRQMAVGSEHALALTEGGDLMVWGWGEHGNCGPLREGNGGKGQRNRIAANEPGMEITMVGAGCATSWIAIEKGT